MNRDELPKIKAPNSLSFVAGTLLIYAGICAVWVFVLGETMARVGGLLLNFCFLLLMAKHWWERRLNAYDRAQEAAADAAQVPSVAMSEGLQKFVVESLRFAVFSVDDKLQIQLETPIFPKSLSEVEDLESRDLIGMLGMVTRLSQDDLQMLKFQLGHAFGMNRIQWTATSYSLPLEAQLKRGPTAFARFNYIPVYEQDRLVRVHLIMQDISEIKEREVKAEAQRKDMEKFFALLQVSDSLFELFMGETRKLFDDIKADLKSLREKSSNVNTIEIANRMFRAVHTIKANAKLFKLTSIQDVAHSVESYLEELRTGKLTFTMPVLAELTQKIMAISEEVYSYASLRKEILSTSERNSAFNLKYRVQWIRSLMNQFASILRDPKFEQRHLKLIQKEFGRALSSFDKASLREYLRGYNQMLQEVASSLGKEILDIETDLEYHHFDSSTLARINDILLHCLRNSIDHGIEAVDEREKLGKNRAGLIRIKTKEHDGMVNIEISDDGRGLDLEKIKAKAIEMNIIEPDAAEKMTEKEIIPLLFHTGVSTASAVTEISGRGLGMDVVRDYVQGLSGNLTMSFIKGGGTTVSVWIPSASEDFITPLGIHDLHDVLDEVVRDYLHYVQDRFVFDYSSLDRITIFTDKMSLVEVLRVLMTDMHQRCPSTCRIRLTVEEHMGRRRVDSFVFYRIKATIQGDTVPLDWAFEKHSQAMEKADSMLRKNGGSLYLRQAQQLEINIPSNIPVRFAQYEFKVLIFADRLHNLPTQMENFFQKVMGGWIFKPYQYPFADNALQELKGSACLVLLDSTMMKQYIESREESDRKKDGVVLFPEEELDIDALNGSAILPENILFVPPSFDEKHFHRCLAGVIFRRFLKEMVRDQANMSSRDKDLLTRAS